MSKSGFQPAQPAAMPAAVADSLPVEAPHPQLLAVLVLYGMPAEESVSYRSWCGVLAAVPAFEQQAELLLWDNSPVTHSLPLSFRGTAHADATNPGLARAYATALTACQERGIPWLLLLDQDTALTEGYAAALIEGTEQASQNVGAFLPRLVHRGRIVSPQLPRRFGPPKAWPEGAPAPSGQRLQAFNSGALLRVAAMQQAGGFDLRFPLDYLDHATFAALQRNGWQLQVLRTVVPHDLASDTDGPSTQAARARQAAVLRAENRFVRLYGSFLDRLLRPLNLLRRALSVLWHKRDAPAAWLIVRAMRNGDR